MVRPAKLVTELGFVLGVGGLASACGNPEFFCIDRADCGPDGRCEVSGACSFPDPSCPSQRRYGALSGRLSHKCVNDDGVAEDASEAALPSESTGASTFVPASESAGSTDPGADDGRATTLVPLPEPGPPVPVEWSCVPPDDDGRVLDGLLALYKLDEGEGLVVENQTCIEADLSIDPAGESIVWNTDLRGLGFLGAGRVASGDVWKLRELLIDAYDEVTIEVWLWPWVESLDTWGRVIGFSDVVEGKETVLFEINQFRVEDGTRGWEAYLRLDSSELHLYFPNLWSDLTQIVLTSKGGEQLLYVDTKVEDKNGRWGSFEKWPKNGAATLTLGNAIDEDRPWIGAITLVAIYGRALSWEEVDQNYKAYWDHEW